MKAIQLLLTAALCATVAARAAPLLDPAGEPTSLAADFLKTDRLSALAGAKKVVIANFRVEFAVENSSKAISSGSGGSTSSRADIKLVGVDDAQRRAMADQLYDALVQGLTSAGLDVVPSEVLRETAAYKSLGPVLKTSLEPVGTRTGQSVFVGAHGMPVYFSNDDRHLGLGSLLGNLSTVQSQNIEPAIAKELDAVVLRATLQVVFAELSTSGGLFQSASSVQTKVAAAFAPETTQYLFVTPAGGRARIYLANAASLPDDMLTLRDTTTDSEKATQAAANLITGLFAKNTKSERHYEAIAAPGAYSAAVVRYGNALAGGALSLVRGAVAAKAP